MKISCKRCCWTRGTRSIDILKIDQSFIRHLGENPSYSAIITAICDLAHGLALNIIAEGVETEAQLEFLRKITCDEVQGFLLSRPISANRVAQLLDYVAFPAHLIQ